MKTFFVLLSVLYATHTAVSNLEATASVETPQSGAQANTQPGDAAEAASAQEQTTFTFDEAAMNKPAIEAERGFNIDRLDELYPGELMRTSTGAILNNEDFPGPKMSQRISQAAKFSLERLALLIKNHKRVDENWTDADDLIKELDENFLTVLETVENLITELLIREWQFVSNNQGQEAYQVVYHNTPHSLYALIEVMERFISAVNSPETKATLQAALRNNPFASQDQFLELLDKRFRANVLEAFQTEDITGDGPNGLVTAPGFTRLAERFTVMAQPSILVIPDNFFESPLYHFLNGSNLHVHKGFLKKEIINRLMPDVPDAELENIAQEIEQLYTNFLNSAGGQLVQEMIPVQSLQERAYVSAGYGLPAWTKGNKLQTETHSSPDKEDEQQANSNPQSLREFTKKPVPLRKISPKDGNGATLVNPIEYAQDMAKPLRDRVLMYNPDPKAVSAVHSDLSYRMLLGPKFTDSQKSYSTKNSVSSDKVMAFTQSLNNLVQKIVEYAGNNVAKLEGAANPILGRDALSPEAQRRLESLPLSDTEKAEILRQLNRRPQSSF